MHWRREILYLLVVAMDICWLAPLAAIISGLVGLPPLPVSVLLALYLAAFWSGRLVTRLHLDETRARIVAIFLAVVTILVVLKVAHYGSYPWLSLTWLAQLAPGPGSHVHLGAAGELHHHRRRGHLVDRAAARARST